MMRPDDGRIEQVRISAAEPTVIDIDGKPVRTRKYEVDGATRYDVWLDSQGVPVKFAVDDNSGKVTFTLASCSGCSTLAGSAARDAIAPLSRRLPAAFLRLFRSG